MTPSDLAMQLSSNIEDIVKFLLPNGKRDGHEWACGDVSGAAGKSCRIHLDGDKRGIWCDFATGEKGDVLDLWRAVRGCNLPAAMDEAKHYLGIREPEFEASKPKVWKKPQKPECKKPRGMVREYLDSRGLSEKTLEAYRIGEQGDRMIFPFMRGGELIMAKSRKFGDGEKPKPTEAGCEKILFGWQAIPEDARSVVITEGEIDAMSAFEMGFPAMSVPFGGGAGNKQDWVENDFDHLERFDKIYLALDADEPGQEATRELIKRLGPYRCLVVNIPKPYKDVNDLLLGGFDHAQFKDLLDKAKPCDPAELKIASDYVDQILNEFYPMETLFGGVTLPWEKLAGRLYFRPGETILLGGYNGQGKTEIAGNMVLWALKQDVRTCVASMEFKPRRWLKRLTRQVCGHELPAEDYIRNVVDWYNERLWVFDVEGTAKSDRMLEVFEYAARKYQIRMFVIDNLAKCGFAEDDYNKQKDFADKLTDFAKRYDAIVLLIHHLRKGSDEHKQGGKMDFKGTGALTDMVDTVLTIWRNKAKEDAEGDEKQDEPDAVLKCHKQRNGEDEPKAALWFHKPSHQFLPYSNAFPLQVVHYEATDNGFA